MKLKNGHKLKIGCNQYTFRWMSDEWMDDCKLQGQCDTMGKFIKVSVTAADRKMTFLHEIIHAIEIDHGFDLPDQVVRVLADHIVAFVRENNIDLREELEM